MIFVCSDRIYTSVYFSKDDLTPHEFDTCDTLWEFYFTENGENLYTRGLNQDIFGWLLETNITFTLKVGRTSMQGSHSSVQFEHCDELIWFGINIPNSAEAAHFKLIWNDEISWSCEEHEWEK